MSIFKSFRFLLGTFLATVSYMVMFGSIVIIPLWLQTHMGYTALSAGITIAPMGIGAVLLGPFLEKIMKKVSLSSLIIFCFATLALSFFYSASFTTQVTWEKVAFSRFILSISMAFYLVPLTAVSLEEIPPSKIPNASGIFHFSRIFCGGAVVSLILYLWNTRATFHRSYLVQSFTAPFSYQKEETIALNTLIDKEAYMLATNDISWLCGWIALGLILLVFFLHKGPSGSLLKRK